MNALKLCYYLSDTGLLEEESIENFGKIYKNINKNKSGNNYENIKYTLNSYLEQKVKSKESLNNCSENIIKAFSDNLIINRYNALNLLYNILFLKLRELYIIIFSKINFFIFKRYNNDINNKNEIKKGKIKKNKNYKDNNNENNSNNENNINNEDINLNDSKEYKITLNFDYDLNKEPPPLDYYKYLRIKNQEKEEEEKREKEKEKEKKKKEEEMKILKIIRKTFVPQIDPYSKEICESKPLNEYKSIFLNKNLKTKNSSEKKKVDYYSLEKKRLEDIHNALITKKIEKEKKENKEKIKEEKERKKIREKYKDIYDKKTNKENIEKLYQSPKKLRSIDEEKIKDNKNNSKEKEKKKFIKKEKIDKTSEKKDNSRVDEKPCLQKQEKKEEDKQNNINDIQNKEKDEEKVEEKKERDKNNSMEKRKEDIEIKEKESLKSNEINIKESSLSLSLDLEKLQNQNDKKLIDDSKIILNKNIIFKKI